LGDTCEFNEKAVWLNGNRSEWGLPTFIQSYFNNLWIDHEYECVEQEVYFYLNDPENIDSVKWNFGDPGSGLNNTSSIFEPAHIYSEPGNYQIELIVYYLDIIDTIDKQITIFAPPTVELGDDWLICEGDSVLLLADGNYNACVWQNDPFLTSTSLVAKLDGNYWIEASTVCGLDQDTVYVEVRPLPEVDLGKDTFIENNSSITLSAPPGYENYLWQDGSNLLEYSTEAPGLFWVEVSDELGCKSSDTILIEPLFVDIHVPTAFSPNGDMLNDVFVPISSFEIELNYELLIFNRYGEMVFESNDFAIGWDGQYHGKPCPVEVYTWILQAAPKEYTSYFKEPLKLSGNVTLLR